MKRLLALLAGGLGLGALLRRRSHSAHASSPADGLRSKLAESRTAEIPREPSAEPSPETADVASRRADVHERARRAIDELGS